MTWQCGPVSIKERMAVSPRHIVRVEKVRSAWRRTEIEAHSCELGLTSHAKGLDQEPRQVTPRSNPAPRDRHEGHKLMILNHDAR
jgi:hypothetical protein